MPTNLPDPRDRKADANHETFLAALFVVVKVAMIIATAMIIWSVWYANR
jgi:hypothetical protein